MLGVLFATLGSFVNEISGSIIKFTADHRKERVLTAAFINTLSGGVVIALIGLARGNFVFQLSSLPFFSARAILEIFQMHLSLMAIARTDRSTQSFLHTLTIPLLLVVDIVLGYTLSFPQIIGIVLVLASAGFLVTRAQGQRTGTMLALLAAVNAVATISLFKYNITHYNSVEAEQTLMYAFLACYFCAASFLWAKENPFAIAWREKLFLAQGGAQAVGSAFHSFALLFGSASVIIAAKRAASVLAGIVSGGTYFKESRVEEKILLAFFLIVGLLFLTR